MSMNIKDLTLKNVGPFKEMHLDFPCTPNANGKLPVTLITEENGTGKSIIIDSLHFTEKEKASIKAFANPDNAFSLMSEMYLRNQLPWLWT